jgi:hypothetical protein
MKNRKQFLGLVLAGAVLFSGVFFLCTLAGCSARTKNVTNLPAGVTQAEVQRWDSEVAALHKIAAVTSSLRQGVIGLEKAGAFPDSVAYVNALRGVAKIDQLELAASDYLKQQPEYFGQPQKDKVRGILSDIAAELQTLNVQSLAGIKNTDHQKQLNLLLQDVTAALNLALSFAQ